jgi:RNA polymerase sigma-70 factor (ECF subfamily)
VNVVDVLSQTPTPEPLANDQQLLRALRGGDENAFRLLYERHQGALFRFALHMTGSKATAEEVTQDVFMHLIGKPRSYDPNKAPLSAYLFGMARNLARRAVQNASLDVCLDDAEELDVAPALDVDVIEKLSNSDELDSLRKALLGLPDLYREVIVLCDLEEMSYAQAAAIVECSSGTIASRLHRAHNMLRNRLCRVAAKGCLR